MTTALGAATLTWLAQTDGATDRKGIPASLYAPTIIYGCSIQPVSVDEDVTNIDYYIGKFRIFAPAAAAAVKVTDYLLSGTPYVTTAGPLSSFLAGASADSLYRVIGAKVWSNLSGGVDHVTIVAEIPSGINGAIP